MKKIVLHLRFIFLILTTEVMDSLISCLWGATLYCFHSDSVSLTAGDSGTLSQL